MEFIETYNLLSKMEFTLSNAPPLSYIKIVVGGCVLIVGLGRCSDLKIFFPICIIPLPVDGLTM